MPFIFVGDTLLLGVTCVVVFEFEVVLFNIALDVDKLRLRLFDKLLITVDSVDNESTSLDSAGFFNGRDLCLGGTGGGIADGIMLDWLTGDTGELLVFDCEDVEDVVEKKTPGT